MVDDDADRARKRVLVGLHRLYGTSLPDIERVPVAGTATDVIRGLKEVRDAGATMLLLNPLGADLAEDREQLERLITTVVPHLD